MCFTSFAALEGQSISPHKYIELQYDKNIELYQGPIHNEAPISRFGNKYLFSSNTKLGSISIGETTYDSLQLRYDVYKHNLVLEYSTEPITNTYDLGQVKSTIAYDNETIYKINIDHKIVDAFTLGSYKFIKVENSNINYPYLLEIENNTLECYIGWHKEYQVNGLEMCYTPPLRKVFLKEGDRYTRIFNKRGIISKLPGTQQKAVKKYCRKNKFKLKTSSVEAYCSLFSFIDNLMETDEK